MVNVVSARFRVGSLSCLLGVGVLFDSVCVRV
jgi:hypothetical protein